MDDRNRIFDWLLSKKDELNLKVKSYTWGDEWLPGYKDFTIQLTFEGRDYTGRGTAAEESTAFIKAAMEAVERTLIRHNGVANSNGIALHIDENKAREKAMGELVERDRFFCHYLTGTPFKPVDLESIENKTLLGCVHKLKERGVEIQLSEMRKLGPFYSAICMGFGKDFYMTLGMGCSPDYQEALEGACMENIRHVVALVENPPASEDFLSIDEFKAMARPGVRNHIELALHPEYRLQEVLRNPVKQEDIAMDEALQITRLELPPFFAELPIFGYRAHSEAYQSLFFGQTTEDKVNMKRLSEFAGRELSFDEIEKCPHPLG